MKKALILFLIASLNSILVVANTKTNSENINTTNKPSDSILIKQFNFESNTVLQSWKAEKGKTKISSRHFKQGKNSLLWSWKANDYLVVAELEGINKAAGMYKGGIPEFYEPAFYPKGKYGGLKMWLYQNTPQNGTMIFQVGSSVDAAKTAPKYKFEVQLNFKGWRSVWVCLEEDAKVPNYKGNDIMKSLVSYPSKELKGSGEIFIDHVSVLEFVSKKRHSDFHFVNSKIDNRADSYKILKPYQKFTTTSFENLEVDIELLAKNSKDINDKLEFLILGNNSENWRKRNSTIETKIASQIKSSKQYYSKLNIVKQNNSITGVPLFATRDEHPAKEGLVYQKVCESTLFPLAIDYRKNGNLDSKNKLIDVFDYIEDQGWAAGSSMGTVDHIIRLNSVAQSIFLIKDDLKKQQKLQSKIEMMAWHSRLGSILDIDYTIAENTDKVRGGALVKLITILLMENGQKKAGILQSFKEYMDYVIDFAPGYGDTMKPDYSVYHHRGTYLNSYGIQSVNTMALIYWLLEDTPYELSKKSTDILKKILFRQSEIAFGTDLHYGVSGRFPLKNSAIGRFLLPAYAFMSSSGNTVSDEELGKRYNYLYSITNPKEIVSILTPSLTYSGTFGTLDLMVNLHNYFGELQNIPKDANYSMPYSSLSVHRSGNAYATVKGYNKYIWDFETGSSNGENSLGRYLSHGALIVAQNNHENGFAGAGIKLNEGFHWGFLPGATTKAMPIEKIYHINKSNKKYIEGYHRSFAETTFASGLSQNKNGMYAMELRDDVGPDEDKSLFDDSFRAKKSYFFIGDEIICLGSNINNDDSRYNTVTTLFQYQWNQKKSTKFNAKDIGNAIPLKRNLNGGYYTDQNGLHYIVRNKGLVNLEQTNQKSLRRVKSNYEKIVAPHIKAYLNHGTSPKDAEYEYQILLNTSEELAKDYADSKSYEVWAKNSDLHSIYHSKTGIEASAIFTANKNLERGTIINSNTPILVMFKKGAEGVSLLTIADPDLKLKNWHHNMSRMPHDITNGRSEGSVVTLTLNGEWFAAKEINEVMSVNIKDGNTVVKIYCKDGKSIDIPLQKRNLEN